MNTENTTVSEGAAATTNKAVEETQVQKNERHVNFLLNAGRFTVSTGNPAIVSCQFFKHGDGMYKAQFYDKDGGLVSELKYTVEMIGEIMGISEGTGVSLSDCPDCLNDKTIGFRVMEKILMGGRLTVKTGDGRVLTSDATTTKVELTEEEGEAPRVTLSTDFGLVPDEVDKITVSASALKKLLSALAGPSHFIRELQVLRDNDALLNGGTMTNPINILTKEYNDWADRVNAASTEL